MNKTLGNFEGEHQVPLCMLDWFHHVYIQCVYRYIDNVIRSRSNSIKAMSCKVAYRNTTKFQQTIQHSSETRPNSSPIIVPSDTFGQSMPLIDWMTCATFVCSRDLQTSALCHGKMSQAAGAAKARSISGSSLIWGNLVWLIWLDIYAGYWR